MVVTCPEALAEKVADRADLNAKTLALKVGQKLEMSEAVKRLIELGFNSVEYVYEPGQFARRGSILDVYSFAGELPYRIDFFDTDIDSIRTFNVETQLSEAKVDAVSIVPPSAADTGSGISLLEFMGPETIVASVKPDYVVERVKAIAAEEFSESAVIADEGDACHG